MTKRRAGKKDADLDDRPFGDSYFADARRTPRRLDRRSAPEDGRRRRAPEAPLQPTYAWHDGFFDDLEPRIVKPRHPAPH